MLVVSDNGAELQSEDATSLTDGEALLTLSVADSGGTRAIAGVARSDVAHLFVTVAGGSSEDVPLTEQGAFAVGNLPADEMLALQALASDGSTIENVTLPKTRPACVGVASCVRAPSASSATAAPLASATTTAYAITEAGSHHLTHDLLTRIDPATLNPLGRTLVLGSNAIPTVVGALALSPDETRLAFARVAGGTIAIVDLASMRITAEIPTRAGASVRSLAWLDNNQLALIEQEMSKPYNRDVTGRWLVRVNVAARKFGSLSLTKKAVIVFSERAGSRLITVLRPNNFRDPTRRVIVADADNRTFLFSVTLPPPSPKFAEDRAVPSADGKHLYILRSGGQVMDIDIDSQQSTLHQVAAPTNAPTATPIGSILLAEPTPQGLVTSGFFTFARGNGIAYRTGVYLIDTTGWTARTLDADARDFTVYGDKIATFNFAVPPFARPQRQVGPGAGVSVYDAASGQRLYHLFDSQLFTGVLMIGNSGHALRQTRTSHAVIPYAFLDSRFDLDSGKLDAKSRRPPLGSLRLVYRGSQTIGEAGVEAATPARRSAASVATASRGAPPLAFSRPATRLDQLPPSPFFKHGIRNGTGGAERILATRRIAAYTDSRGRRALLYLIRTSEEICAFTYWRGSAGGGCNHATDFFAGRHVVAGSGHLISGVTDESVATVVIVGTHGGRHRVTLTPDGGFIYDCRAYSGCTGCIIDHVEAFDSAGQRIEVDRVTGGCAKGRKR